MDDNLFLLGVHLVIRMVVLLWVMVGMGLALAALVHVLRIFHASLMHKHSSYAWMVHRIFMHKYAESMRMDIHAGQSGAARHRRSRESMQVRDVFYTEGLRKPRALWEIPPQVGTPGVMHNRE